MINAIFISHIMPKRAISIDEFLKKKFDTMPFEDEWKDFVGEPEYGSGWIVYGSSGNGKTTFILQLVKYMKQFGTVAINSLEEGAKASLQRAMIDVGYEKVKKGVLLLDGEPIEDLRKRLAKHRSPKTIIIDSLQYSGLNLKSYKALRAEFPKKTFIFTSHAEGKKPSGRLARAVEYDVDVKVRIEGYRAFPKSRYGGNQYYDIWKEGAREYWGEID